MSLLSKIWRRMFRSQSTEDEAMPEQTPAAAPVAPATPAASVSIAVAEHAAAKADIAALQAVTINPSAADVDALKAALAADTGVGRLSVIEAAPAAPVDPDAEGADPVEPQVNTDTLRDLLKALGHDIGDVWDDVVKLAKKAI